MDMMKYIPQTQQQQQPQQQQQQQQQQQHYPPHQQQQQQTPPAHWAQQPPPQQQQQQQHYQPPQPQHQQHHPQAGGVNAGPAYINPNPIPPPQPPSRVGSLSIEEFYRYYFEPVTMDPIRSTTAIMTARRWILDKLDARRDAEDLTVVLQEFVMRDTTLYVARLAPGIAGFPLDDAVSASISQSAVSQRNCHHPCDPTVCVLGVRPARLPRISRPSWVFSFRCHLCTTGPNKGYGCCACSTTYCTSLMSQCPLFR